MQPNTATGRRAASRNRGMRKRVASAFRRMARGVDMKTAYASTVEFYRSGGQPWTRQLA